MIRFRGIPLEDTSDIDGVDFDGTFVYGNYIKYGDGTLIVGDALQADEDGYWPSWWVPVDPKTVGQFTGLKDMNGKDIYKGDIIHGYDQEPDRDDGYIGSSVTDVVNFKYGAFWIGDSWYKVMVMTPPIVEIIGNVHVNPELLEETHE
ncbi:hypothetical protein E5289_16805 [Lactiplantibacillus pentosus]